jgi:hypothetical protein
MEKKQGVVGRRITEAKFSTMAQGNCEGLWIYKVIEDEKTRLTEGNLHLTILTLQNK